jgi:phosphoenolpyruvate synthase/pyruvate phosphate dikinase
VLSGTATFTAQKREYATVGELVLIASALDYQLNHICILVLGLAASTMLEPVVASIDSAQKIEILKAYATKITKPEWKKALKAHAEIVEEVNRWRNIAAHSVMSFKAGAPVLTSPAAAKLFKALDLTTKTAETITIDQLVAAVRKGERGLGSGETLLVNFARVAAELALRKAKPSGV